MMTKELSLFVSPSMIFTSSQFRGSGVQEGSFTNGRYFARIAPLRRHFYFAKVGRFV